MRRTGASNPQYAGHMHAEPIDWGDGSCRVLNLLLPQCIRRLWEYCIYFA